jgi:phage-related protein
MAQSIDSYVVLSSATKRPITRVKETNFGQGYRQILQDGFNTDEEVWDVEFKPMTASGINALETILLNSVKGSANYLSWTPEDETTVKYWTAHDILKVHFSPVYRKISCSLRREFPLS